MDPPVVSIEDSDSDSDATHAQASARPKLRTRAAAPTQWSVSDIIDDDDSDSESASDSALPSAAKKHKRAISEDDEPFEPLTDAQMAEEEAADDAEPLADDDNGDNDDSVSDADDGTRRRSSRARKAPPAFGGIDYDFEDAHLESLSKPRRDRSSGGRKASAKSARKASKRARSKKKNASSSSGSASDTESDGEFRATDDSDDDSGGGGGTNARLGGSSSGRQRAAAAPAKAENDDDDNMFLIDKVIAREVHTLKEWTRICANKNTRFLTHMSIFLPDDGDDDAAPKRTPDKADSKVDSKTDATADNKVVGLTDAKPEDKADAKADAKVEDKVEDKAAPLAVATDSPATAADAPSANSSSAPATAAPATPPPAKRALGASVTPVRTPGSIHEVSQTEERFLVKWKGLSYLHVSWETEANLLDVDKNAKGKIQRFRDKELSGLFRGAAAYGDEYFSPEFRLVDRILDIQDHPGDAFLPEDSDDEDAVGASHRYLYVKWKSLAYDELTWEREDDVSDDAAIAVYEDRLMRAAARHRRVALAALANKKPPSGHKVKFRGYSTAQPPPFRDGLAWELRDYQLTGVNWILFNWYQRRNSLLADEMGLGKTVQTVTFINHLAVVEELPGPYLIIAPLSTLGHWQREFQTWTHLDAVVYHGSAVARKQLQAREFQFTGDEYARADALIAQRTGARPHKSGSSTAAVVARTKRPHYRFDVLITTPEMCATSDFAALARVQWQVLAVDEAHRLKNKTSKFSSLIHRSIKFETILLLTGTPLQNNVEELWTLLNFLDRDRFDSMDAFLERFGDLKDITQVEQLHAELKPFLLRRMKEDVEKTLAPKEETIVEVELTVLQKQYYRAIYEMNTEFLARGRKKAQTPSLMNVAMELRKCCNHPFLIKGVEEQEIIRLQQQQQKAANSSDANTTTTDPQALTQQIQELLVTSSGKLVLLDKLLPRLQANGHRVLIFSQFKIMLDILQDYLHLRAYNCERIDGNITGNDRQAAIDRYCAPDSVSFIMLLSTRAGGVGINLTAADTVIIYDSDWNPQNDLQAQARCHRIGQKKSVKIYRLLTSKTYELHMFHQASLKLGLDQAVLGGIRSSGGSGGSGNLLTASGTGKSGKSKVNAPSREEIEHLLKHGAYEIFKEEKDGDAEAASKRFSEESIDQILSRSTKIIHDPKANGDAADGKKSLMSSFSKATFVSSSNPDEQVALDDPDFWTKVIGLQEVDDKPIEPSPLKKRRRRPVKSYLLDDSDGEQHGVGRGRKKPKALHDNDEFVISSDASDDDDDDDEALDDLDDGEFAVAERKRQRAAEKIKPATPPLIAFVDAIAEQLAAFGYGRWDDMVATRPALQQYPLAELQLFTQHYIVQQVHIAAGTAVVHTVPLSNGELPEPLAPTKKLVLIDNFAERLGVAAAVLRDLTVARMSLVALPKSLRLKPTSVKAQRDANTRLQQIERMFQVQHIIRAKIGPPSPMVSLINELQALPRDRVRAILDTGELPEPEALAALAQSLAAKAQGTADGVTTTDAAATTSAAGADAADAAAPSAESEPASGTVSVEAEPVGSNDAAAAAATYDKSDVAMADAAANATPETTAAAATESADATVKELPSVSTEAEAAAPPPPKSPSELLQARADRADALRRLRELPDVGVPDLVAPWWISVLDDVILLFYVYKDGWLKGRVLPPQLVQQSSLFGARAAPHATLLWPTVAVLTRRVKAVISTWTNTRRLRQQSQAVAPPQPVPPPSMMPHGLGSPPLSYGATASGAGGRHGAAPFNSSRHNRFAKIVFAFGIPDTRTCRDEPERFEKWRYFLQDELLGVAGQPLVELHAEALDLERCCRLRAAHPGATPDELAAQAAASGTSILGGRRGYWLLTTTQCRRLLQRVDLFRLLRTQILVLPPSQLVDIVARVVTLLHADPSKNEFPRWWSSPRHDILLLQGVECYGLDEYLSHVWQLPLFAHANASGSFPNTTWAENHVAALALRCRRAMSSGISGSPSASIASNAVADSNAGARRATIGDRKRKAAATQSKREATEVRQRIRDIQGMRDEDPYFAPAVRVRQLDESKRATDAAAQRAAAAAVALAATLADPSVVDLIKDVESHEVTAADDAAVVAAVANAPLASSPPASPRPAAKATASTPTAASEPFASPRGRQQSIQEAMKTQRQVPRASAKAPRANANATRANAPRAARTGGPTLRARAPRAWDVIVIDESDDDDDE